VAALVRRQYNRIEPVERVSIQPKGRSYSRTLFARGPDEDYNMITRGRLLDRIKVRGADRRLDGAGAGGDSGHSELFRCHLTRH
jgi:hypothetical protein